MKTQVTLENKEIRTIIAKFLGIPEEQVIPLRYTFAIEGLPVAEIERRLNDD